jgi:hypothetical protein
MKGLSPERSGSAGQLWQSTMVGPGHGAAAMAGFCGEDSSSAVMAWLQLCTAASGVWRSGECSSGARRTQRRGCVGERRLDAAAAQRPEQRRPWQREARCKDGGALTGAQQHQMLDERRRCPGHRWSATQAAARPDGGTLGCRRR